VAAILPRDAGGEGQQGAEEFRTRLALLHANHKVQGLIAPLHEMLRQRLPRAGIMPAIKPKRKTCWQ